jgi:hypothetical protein
MSLYCTPIYVLEYVRIHMAFRSAGEEWSGIVIRIRLSTCIACILYSTCFARAADCCVGRAYEIR